MTQLQNPALSFSRRKLKLQDAFHSIFFFLGSKHKASSSEKFFGVLQENLHLCCFSRSQQVVQATESDHEGDPSPPLLTVDRKRQRDVERVVMLEQRGVLVVKHQLLERRV